YTTHTGTSFIGQWQHETSVENRTGGDKVWFKLILPL
ncbi:MAG: phenol degradation protein meta, partial [Zoogloea sp.]|nr:phenol degradation protein meta [Zoogloea sp.]